MSDTYPTLDFQCGDTAALVTYLYDECEPVERGVIAAHIASCPACAAEIASLGATRTQLAAWTPPSPHLGFQITETGQGEGDERGKTAKVLRPARWWSQPLPAWAQAAAAVAIFTSGVAIGVGQQRPAPVTAIPVAATTSTAAPVVPAPATTTAPVTAPAPASTASVTPRDLEQLERRLRGEMAQLRTVSTTASAAGATADDEVLRQVRALIAESEQRQRSEVALRTAKLAMDLEVQRRADLADVQQTVGQIQAQTGRAFQDQNQMLRTLVNFRGTGGR
jgi:hypothetical protein